MTAEVQTAANTRDTTPLPFRAHTILGACEALGEDFGISPLWFRVPFAATVLISPLWAIVGYLALSVVILGSRLIFPNPKTKPAAVAPVAAIAANPEKAEELPLAA